MPGTAEIPGQGTSLGTGAGARTMEGGRQRRPVGSSKAWAEGPSMDVATREGPGTGQRAFGAGTNHRKGRQKAKEAHAQGQRRPAPQQAGGGHTRGGLWGQTGKSHLVRINCVHLEPRTRLKRHIWQPSALGSNGGHHPRGSAGCRGRRLQKSGHWGQAKGKRARAAGYVKKKKFQ